MVFCRGCKWRLYCLKIILLILIFQTSVMAEDPLLELADSLMLSRFYNDAITEYYRYSFFNSHSSCLDDIYSKVGFCFANQMKWDDAIEAIDKSIFYAQNDSLIEQRKVDRAVMYLASGNIDKAQSYLKEIASSSTDNDVRDRANILLFLSLILSHDWQAAYDTYELEIKNQHIESVLLESALINAINIDYKSPTISSLLSTLIPGMGQFYNGRWLAGLNAMALNGTFGYLTINSLIKERYTSGFLVFIFLFQRYYNGNRYQASHHAIEHNEMANSYYEKIILDHIQSIYDINQTSSLRKR